MNFVKKTFYTLIILLFLIYSCVKKQSNDLLDEPYIRYIAVMYNYGPGYSFEQIKTFAKESTYDDDVLSYYYYLRGEISLEQMKLMEKGEIYDERIRKHIQENLPADNSNGCLFIDNFDDPLPIEIFRKDTSSGIKSGLSERIYHLLLRDWENKGLFRIWYEDFYGSEIGNEQLGEYADLLARVAVSYSSVSLTRLRSTSSTFYKESVDLSKIPVELMLAIAYKESRFFAGSFRAEAYQDKIEAISMGLCHILIDADTLGLDYPDIGNGSVDMRTFELISYYYLGNDYGKKNVFNEFDLLQLEGNTLVSMIYLSLIYERLAELLQ